MKVSKCAGVAAVKRPKWDEVKLKEGIYKICYSPTTNNGASIGDNYRLIVVKGSGRVPCVMCYNSSSMSLDACTESLWKDSDYEYEQTDETPCFELAAKK